MQDAGATFISPFMGRMDDRYADAESGFKLLEKIAKVKANYGYTSKIIAASVRHTKHVEQAALAGADIAAIPFNMMEQMFCRELTGNGLEIFCNAEK